MKLSQVISLYEMLSDASSETPIKLTIARNINLMKPIIEAFNKEKTDKFNSLVVLDENGSPVLKSGIKKLVDSGQIKQTDLPFEFFDYSSESALSDLKEFIDKKTDTICNYKPISVSLGQSILIDGGDKITLNEYLESPVNKLDHNLVASMLEHKLIV